MQKRGDPQDGSVISLVIADALAGDDVIGRPTEVTSMADLLKGLPSRRPKKKPVKKPVVASSAQQSAKSSDPPPEEDASESTSSMNTYEIRVREEKRKHTLRRFR